MGKQLSRFLGIDDLVHTTLSTEAPTTRRSAKFVLDQARSGSDFGLYDDCPSLEPRQAFVEIPNGVVRGSVVIDSPSGTILPRTCHPSPRDGFINYMKESQYDFESGLKLRFGRPYLDNMHEYYIDDDVLYLTPDE